MKDEVAKQMQDTLNWAVLGTGVIANEMAQALQKMGKSLYAVGNRTHEKAVLWNSTTRSLASRPIPSLCMRL